MCGIVGYSWPDRKAIKEAIGRIKHRGPDDDGLLVDRFVSLGQVRLSILDTSSAGHQPFFDKQTGRYLIFNGEIYNFKELKAELEPLGYKFVSGSDTEMILKAYDAWGPACVKRFNGMWAFCLYDPKKKDLFLSRDRFGKKPLYYTFSKGKFAFSSEIKGVLATVERSIDEKMVSDYLYFDFLDHTDRTFFKGVRKIPAAHSAFFDLQKKSLRIKRYYDLAHPEGELFSIFDDACQLRTVSDVPVSISLSGGVDSTSIAAIYATHKRPIKAFTTTSSSGVGDETAKIALLEKRYPGMFDVQRISLDVDDVIGEFRKIVWHLESPIVGSILPRWMIAQGVRKVGYKVLICGEGADEMLGGYASAYPFVAASLIRRLHLLAGIRMLIQGREYFTARTWPFFFYYLLPKGCKRLAIRLASSRMKRRFGLRLPADVQERLRNSHFSSAEDYFVYGLWRGGVPMLLNYNDKIPMAHGVETRAPFMDFRLVEHFMAMPAHRRVDRGYTKFAFRKLMERFVPKRIIWDKRKIGFQSPVVDYLLSQSCRDFVSGSFRHPLSAKFVDKNIFLARYEKFIAGERKDKDYLFKVVALELFLQEFFSSDL